MLPFWTLSWTWVIGVTPPFLVPLSDTVCDEANGGAVQSYKASHFFKLTLESSGKILMVKSCSVHSDPSRPLKTLRENSKNVIFVL